MKKKKNFAFFIIEGPDSMISVREYATLAGLLLPMEVILEGPNY